MKSGSVAAFRAAGAMGDVDPEPPARAAGPKCSQCGRFVPHKSIEYPPSADMHEGALATGECGRDGRVTIDVGF